MAEKVTFSCEYFRYLMPDQCQHLVSCLLSEQSYTFIEEVPPQKEDSLLQEGPDEDEFKLKLDLNMSEV